MVISGAGSRLIYRCCVVIEVMKWKVFLKRAEMRTGDLKTMPISRQGSED